MLLNIYIYIYQSGPAHIHAQIVCGSARACFDSLECNSVSEIVFSGFSSPCVLSSRFSGMGAPKLWEREAELFLINCIVFHVVWHVFELLCLFLRVWCFLFSVCVAGDPKRVCLYSCCHCSTCFYVSGSLCLSVCVARAPKRSSCLILFVAFLRVFIFLNCWKKNTNAC